MSDDRLLVLVQGERASRQPGLDREARDQDGIGASDDEQTIAELDARHRYGQRFAGRLAERQPFHLFYRRGPLHPAWQRSLALAPFRPRMTK